MQKSRIFIFKPFIFIFSYLLGQSFAFAVDMVDGVWKGLNQQSQLIASQNLISGSISNKVYYTNTYQSDNGQQKYQDTFLYTNLGLKIKLNSGFSIKTVAKFNKMSQPSQIAEKNHFFNNEGAYIDELVLNYNYKNISALAGKFVPDFGVGWSEDNGIWVSKIAKNYKMNEKLGIGAMARFGNKKTIGEYVFGLSGFTNDRKNLDNSIITNRESATKDDGLVGDTRSLGSNVASMNVNYQFSDKENLSYHFAYSTLAINKKHNNSNISSKIDNQKSLALNMNYQYPINQDILIDGLLEYVEIENLGGDIDSGANFLTANLTTYFNNYYLTIARAQERQLRVGGVDNIVNELSLGYKFDNFNTALKGLSLAIGYNQELVNNNISQAQSDAFGLRVSHKLKF